MDGGEEGRVKRFLLFEYPEYYPSGGKGDVVGDFDSIQAAIERIKNNDRFMTYSHDLLDMETRTWVELSADLWAPK